MGADVGTRPETGADRSDPTEMMGPDRSVSPNEGVGDQPVGSGHLARPAWPACAARSLNTEHLQPNAPPP
jgi:hypothetical protein